MNLQPVPPQPPESSWAFIEKLKEPRHVNINWRRLVKNKNEIDLRCGVKLVEGFADPKDTLRTAYDDLQQFFAAGNIAVGEGYRIETGLVSTDKFESYRLEVTASGCRILANDTDGIRRGIYFLEDEISRTGGPFLTLGVRERKPFVTTRVSRCFFGPIKRPPKLRDELMDDVDYYPDNYLARLAYEGINGLWLTIEFKDLCQTDLAPEYGETSEKRLAKLRRTVNQCARYGIKIYIFCIEPKAWEVDSAILARHPEMGGIRQDNKVFFCPFSETSQQFLSECIESIFTEVPGLGGLINISLGERATTCASLGAEHGLSCPKKRNCQPCDILRETMKAMREGMNAADPAAELICWLYVPGNGTGRQNTSFDWIEDIAGNMPEGVILQYNFESNGSKEQFGKPRHAGDYWLSYVGPSEVFRGCAARAKANRGRMSAKVQVACSHEVATVPYLPVPSSLYHKYAAMREMGVSAAMMCWYFGNHPGIMNKAAGELSFEPLPENEGEFLQQLAAVDWADRVEDVAKAYQALWEGYQNYPVNCMVQYYGPMHDGPVWPLFLKPIDEPLAPTWLLKLDFSGDRIGEAVNFSHSFDEVLALTSRMSENWNRGLALLKEVLENFPDNPERAREVGIVEALSIQFESAAQIYRFYALREKLLRMKGLDRLVILREMKRIVKDEIALDERLLKLVAADPALGFHPEAEGYKYFPEKINWRIQQLNELLNIDFPEVEVRIECGQILFPEYTGKAPSGLTYHCIETAPVLNGVPVGEGWNSAEFAENEHFGARQSLAYVESHGHVVDRWKAVWDGTAVYFGAICKSSEMNKIFSDHFPQVDLQKTKLEETVEIVIEPQRLFPPETFVINRDGSTGYRAVSGRPNASGWKTVVSQSDNDWSLTFKLPLSFFEGMVTPQWPIRVNIFHRLDAPALGVGIFTSWAKPVQSDMHRLAYGMFSPKELGWFVFTDAGKRG